MDRAGFEDWLRRYFDAWASNDPQDVADLFTEDAIYSPFPWPREDRHWRGRDVIVKQWLAHGDSKRPWRFEHQILAVEGDAAVIEGWTDYDPTDEEPLGDAYANVWLVRFAPDGRAREFVEWWIQRPRPSEA